MNIKDAEGLSGVSRRNIRFYEQKGLLYPARNRENDYREYSAEDIETLKLIRALRMMDMPLELIRDVMQGEVPLDAAAAQHSKQLRTRIKQMETALKFCTELGNTQPEAVDVDDLLQRMDAPENKDYLPNRWKADAIQALVWNGALLCIGAMTPVVCLLLGPLVALLWMAVPAMAWILDIGLLVLWGMLGFVLEKYGSWWKNTLLVHVIPCVLCALPFLINGEENPVAQFFTNLGAVYYGGIAFTFAPVAVLVQPVWLWLLAPLAAAFTAGGLSGKLWKIRVERRGSSLVQD